VQKLFRQVLDRSHDERKYYTADCGEILLHKSSISLDLEKLRGTGLKQREDHIRLPFTSLRVRKAGVNGFDQLDIAP
jgi:hypothetical protein